ncbi:MAG TPA: LD-carboxypeptidase [Fimbriimonas sp.]|nr:LD-carboxypeptidase [Fimbriimonas sp.]
MKPRALKPGDTIAFVSPASPIAPEKLEFATNLLESEGYGVRLMPNALAAEGYLAGSDDQRARDLQNAFADDEIAAVYCTRGGYGCARLFPHLDLDAIAGSRKLFLGFSDVTTLHIALNRRGLPTVHAPMGITLSSPREPWVIESFTNVLKGGNPIPAMASSAETVVGGLAEGTLVGGCMCLICDTICTPDEIVTDGAILLLEDVDEAPHRIDAMVTHFLNAGLAQRAAGFLIGEMTRTDERIDEGIGGVPWKEILRDRLAPLGKPMVFDFPLGHAKQMLSLPLGIRVRLDADSGTLEYLESLCA